MNDASSLKAERFLGSIPPSGRMTLGDHWQGGRASIAQHDLHFDPGDWSGSPCPDLVIATVLSSRVGGRFDFGSGIFSTTLGHRHSCVIAPGVQNMIMVDAAHTVRTTAISYAALLAFAGEESGLPADGYFGALHRYVDTTGRLAKFADALWLHGRENTSANRLYVDGLTLELVAELLTVAGPSAEPVRGGLATWQRRRVDEFIEANLDGDLGVEQLAGIANLSTRHFGRAFSQSFGCSVHCYVVERRMARARELLLRTTRTISDIALAVGYQTPQAFARAFRGHTLCSARHFRRNHG